MGASMIGGTENIKKNASKFNKPLLIVHGK
jgi:hypothetical protein